jgi:hypothetical protein
VRGKFDIITYHDAPEHVADPSRWLRQARRFLCVRGRPSLTLQTPLIHATASSASTATT